MDRKIKIVAVLGACAVGLGAFGAHGLRPLLDDSQLETFKTASLYHFIHLLAMFVIASNPKVSKVNNQSFLLFFFGIILFSGSLYILSTKHLMGGDIWDILGPITPLGGVLLIAGWLNLFRSNHTSDLT